MSAGGNAKPTSPKVVARAKKVSDRRVSSPNDSEPSQRRTRGGHLPTGTSATRRTKSSNSPTRKGERARATLVEASRRVFERKGYIDARVADIVREAGMAHGSFYTYFPSKLEAFQAVLAEMGESMRQSISHAPEDVPGDTVMNLKRANRRYLEHFREHTRLMALMEQVATIDPVIAKFRLDARRRHVERVSKTIARLQERGQADPEVDAKAMAGALVAMLSSYAYWSTVRPMQSDLDTTAHTVTVIWARAIGLTSAMRE